MLDEKAMLGETIGYNVREPGKIASWEMKLWLSCFGPHVISTSRDIDELDNFTKLSVR